MTFGSIFTLFQATFYAVFTLFQATFRCKGTKKNVYMQEKFTFIEKKSLSTLTETTIFLQRL